MFVCGSCKAAVGPKVSPNTVVEAVRERVYTYTVRTEEGKETRSSAGSEIVKELKICNKCAGLEDKAGYVVDVKSFIALGNSLTAHAQSCQGFRTTKHADGTRTQEDCQVCKRNRETWGTIPAPILNNILQEPRKHDHSLQSSLAAYAVERLIERTQHNTKRAKADYGAAYSVLKKYEQAGGGL